MFCESPLNCCRGDNSWVVVETKAIMRQSKVDLRRGEDRQAFPAEILVPLYRVGCGCIHIHRRYFQGSWIFCAEQANLKPFTRLVLRLLHCVRPKDIFVAMCRLRMSRALQESLRSLHRISIRFFSLCSTQKELNVGEYLIWIFTPKTYFFNVVFWRKCNYAIQILF